MLTSLITGMLKQAEGTTLQLEAVGHGAMVEVTIREETRGLPVEALPAAFARMRNGEPSDAAAEEPETLRSLSLSLARGLALLQGGSLQIGRDAEGGLIASFALPAAPAETLVNTDRPPDRRKTT
jgi:K+-sensing histidine kinase KdpD